MMRFISLRSYFCVICWERYKKQGEGESLRSFYSLIDETFLLYGKRAPLLMTCMGIQNEKMLNKGVKMDFINLKKNQEGK